MARVRHSLLGELLLLNEEARRDAIATRELGAATDFLAGSLIAEESVLHVRHLRKTLGDVIESVTCHNTRAKLLHVERGLAALAT